MSIVWDPFEVLWVSLQLLVCEDLLWVHCYSSLADAQCYYNLIKTLSKNGFRLLECPFKKGKHLAKLEILIEIFDLISFQVTEIIAVRKEWIDIHITCFVPDKVLHVMSETYLCGESFGPFKVIDVLWRSHVPNPEAIFGFCGVKEVESIAFELLTPICSSCTAMLMLNPSSFEHLLSQIVIVSNHHEQFCILIDFTVIWFEPLDCSLHLLFTPTSTKSEKYHSITYCPGVRSLCDLIWAEGFKLKIFTCSDFYSSRVESVRFRPTAGFLTIWGPLVLLAVSASFRIAQKVIKRCL